MRYLTTLMLFAVVLSIPPSTMATPPQEGGYVTNDIGDADADLTFTPVEPCRIIDTRYAIGGPMLAGTIRPFFVAGTSAFTGQGGKDGGCGIPEGASAAALNVVAVTPSSAGWLKAYAYDDPLPTPPLAATINFGPVPGLAAIANGTVVPICEPTSGTCTYDLLVQVSGGANLDMVVDVAGYFQAFPAGDVQQRVTGTCPAGSSIRVVNADGTVTCESDDNTNAATMCGSGYYLDGDGNCRSTSSYLQRRVTGYCSPGSSIRVVNSNGTVSCETDNDVNTNAATLCSNGYFLNGDGTCDPVSGVTETIGILGYYSASHTGGGGTTRTTTIGSTTNRFCALSSVEMSDTDSTGEYARCQVYFTGGSWYLQAYLAQPSDDANVYCRAYCFRLN